MSDLIDTTEMYLKAVYELEEEGVPALRARIVERLEQSGPTVSETVARLERAGLLHVGEGRQIHFTEQGFKRAEAVMRRHRLAERLLHDVIKLDWPHVHEEACRWEHVVSDVVADKIAALLECPDVDAYGNPIPRSSLLECCGSEAKSKCCAVQDQQRDPHVDRARTVQSVQVCSLAAAVAGGLVRADMPVQCEIVRFSERVQVNPEDLEEFEAAGVVPGAAVTVVFNEPDEVEISAGQDSANLPLHIAEGVFVAGLIKE